MANAYLDLDSKQHWQKALNAVGMSLGFCVHIYVDMCVDVYQCGYIVVGL